MKVYIVIEQEGEYSDKEWMVLGVYSDSKEAIRKGFTTMIGTALQPWKLKHYKNRSGKYANLVGLNELHIEEWRVGGRREASYYLGYQEHDGSNKSKMYVGDLSHMKPYQHYVDNVLKREEDEMRSCEEMLMKWKDELDRGSIPEELMQTVVKEIHVPRMQSNM